MADLPHDTLGQKGSVHGHEVAHLRDFGMIRNRAVGIRWQVQFSAKRYGMKTKLVLSFVLAVAF